MRSTRKSKGTKRESSSVKKRSRHLDGVKDIAVDDIELLQRFVTDHGKIIPSRLSGATAKQQRQIRHGVRRARVIGLLP